MVNKGEKSSCYLSLQYLTIYVVYASYAFMYFKQFGVVTCANKQDRILLVYSSDKILIKLYKM